MDPLVVGVCSLLGLVSGSFANVVIHRLPADLSIVSPPSACPACGHAVRPRDNVPVLSWLLLHGRCRDCATPISIRYPAVEAVTALAFGAVGARVGLDWALPGFLLFAWTLVVVAIIDLRTRRIPNRLTYPLTPMLLGLLTAAALLHGEPLLALRALGGGLAAFACLLTVALASPRGMGMGDVKLAAFIGVGLGYLGWGHVAVGIFGGFGIGAAVAIGLLAARLRTRKDAIPFGPSLAAGGILAVLAGGAVVDLYVTATGLS